MRAALDAEFANALGSWHDRAVHLDLSDTANRSVVNTISGGTYHGPVLMGRTFSNIDVSGSSGQADHGPTQD